MTPERWQQVKELFHSALEVAPEQRATFLDKECGSRESLRREVESLLNAHERSGSFINSPAYVAAAELLAEDAAQLGAGERLGSYEVIRTLGHGGMGEVYLAIDKRLGRKVALKLLTSHLTKDRERLRRFEQEARTASSLNHPNILTIYEIGQEEGKRFIATEYIEGETLRQRMGGGRMKIDETLEIGNQIASALQAAHAAGIIHRDIKPENIMLREDSIVKVLDFGLAKLVNQDGFNSSAETGTRVKTQSGMVMGTISYMSPEQARGLSVDVRTDIWSLGCVLYEMLAGRSPFEADTTSDTIVAILEKEPPPLAHVEPSVPEAFEWMVGKALVKDREDRYQTVREMHTDLKRLKQRLDVATELERMKSSAPAEARTLIINEQASQPETKTGETATNAAGKNAGSTVGARLSGALRNRKRSVVLIISAVVVLGVLALVLTNFFGRKLSTDSSQTAVLPQTAGSLTTAKLTYSSGLDIYPTLSPDGNSVSYSSNRDGNFEIYVKQLTPGGGEIQLTSDGQQNLEPAWSPDGTTIAYYSKNRGGIWLIPSLGGAARQLTEFGAHPAWSRDGSMIAFQSQAATTPGDYSVGPSTIWIIPARGGAARQITQVGTTPGGHYAPSWSPDGKRLLFISNNYSGSEIWAVSAQGSELKQITRGERRQGNAIYTPDGQSIYYTAGVNTSTTGLWKQKMEPVTGEPVGEPVLAATVGAVYYRSLAISADGKKLVYSLVSNTSNLWSVPVAQTTAEAAGAPVALTDDTSLRNNLAVFSPDGRKIAFTSWRGGTNSDVWVMDADGKNPVQLTTNPASDFVPSWFPDGTRIAYLSNRSGHYALWATTLPGGKDSLLADVGTDMDFGRMSPDGKWVVFNSSKAGATNLWKVAVSGGDPIQLTFDKESMGFPCWSPDGQWLAFKWTRGDSSYAGIIPSAGGTPMQLTLEPGESWPYTWSPDGNRIVFAGLRNGYWNIYWVSRDGKMQKQLTKYSKLNAFVRYPAWSPSGDRIVYEYSETKGNIWLMELE